MGEGFVRFKKKYLVDALVKSILSGLSLCLLVIATFLTVIKLADFDFNILYPILLGIGSGLLLGTVMFFVLRPTNKSVAKRLDKSLGLNEKVQTMVAFENEDGGITEIQRNHANFILDSEKCSIFNWKGWAVFIVAAVLSIAFMVTSLLIPAKADEPVDEEPKQEEEAPKEEEKPREEFDANEHHKKALKALIEEVKASSLQDEDGDAGLDGTKDKIIALLEKLLSDIDTFKYQDEMIASVKAVIVNTTFIIDEVNTVNSFYDFVAKSDNEDVKALASALITFDYQLVNDTMTELRDTLRDPSTFRAKSVEWFDVLNAYLTNTTVSHEDKVYLAIKNLCNTFGSIKDSDETSGAPYWMGELDRAMLTNAKEDFGKLMPQQKINNDVKIRVVEELRRIFGITEEDVPDTERGELDTDEKENDEERGDDGGYGSGNTLVGSNDVVIDPDEEPDGDISNIYVEYGEIIGRYDGYLNTFIEEKLDKGEITEEMAELLKEYFDALLTPPEN